MPKKTLLKTIFCLLEEFTVVFLLYKIFASSFVKQHCFALSSSETPFMFLYWRNNFHFHVGTNGWNQELTRSQGIFIGQLKPALQTPLRYKSWDSSHSVLQSTELRSRLFITAQQGPPMETKHRSTDKSSHERNKKRKVQISRRETKIPTNNVKKKKKKVKINLQPLRLLLGKLWRFLCFR